MRDGKGIRPDLLVRAGRGEEVKTTKQGAVGGLIEAKSMVFCATSQLWGKDGLGTERGRQDVGGEGGGQVHSQAHAGGGSPR